MASDDEAAPATFDEEEATRRAKKMKVDELRAALEAAGEDAEGTKPVLVERAVAAARAAAQAMNEEVYEGDEAGYFIEEGQEIAVGNVLLGKKGDEWHNCVVEEVTETGYKVLFTAFEGEDGDRAELPREHLRYYYEEDYEIAGLPVEEGHDIAVGNNLLGERDGEYYDVVVEEVTETGYKVLFTASGDREELPREHLRIAYPYEEGYDDDDEEEEEGDEEGYFVWEDGIPVGAALLGRKSDDGQYYDCVVEEVTDTGYKVLFTEYGDDEENREELPLEHLRYYYPDEESGSPRNVATVLGLVGGAPGGREGDDDDDDEGEYGDEAEEDAPAAFDEEEATRRATSMKVEELRAALEAAGEDTEGTKPVLVERAVAAARAAAAPPPRAEGTPRAPVAEEEGDEAGLFVEDYVDDIAVGAELLGRKRDDGQYYGRGEEEVRESVSMV